MSRVFTLLVVATLMTVLASTPAAAVGDAAQESLVQDATTHLDAGEVSDYCRPENGGNCDFDGDALTVDFSDGEVADYCRPENGGNCGLNGDVLTSPFETLDASPQDYCRPEDDEDC